MNRKTESATESTGLLAIGSTRRWDVSIDESEDGDEWTMELDGHQFYLSFALDELPVVERIAAFLKRGPRWERGAKRTQATDDENNLTIGRFGSCTVSLAWDDEDFVRCFLIVGSKSRSTMIVNLYDEDISCLITALSQVMTDLA